MGMQPFMGLLLLVLKKLLIGWNVLLISCSRAQGGSGSNQDIPFRALYR